MSLKEYLFPIRLHLPVKEARISVMVAALVNVIAMTTQFFRLGSVPEMPIWPAIIGLSAGLFVLTYLIVAGKNVSMRTTTLLFMLNTLSVSTTFFILSPMQATLNPNWAPFQSTKMACLVVGLLSPGIIAGLFGLTAHIVTTTYLSYTFPLELQNKFVGEPYLTWLFMLIGFLALFFRMRTSYLQGAYTQAQAGVVVANRLAQSNIELCDLMSVPLESLENSLDQIKKGNVDFVIATSRMGRAVERLRQINSMLVGHGPKSYNHPHSQKESRATQDLIN